MNKLFNVAAAVAIAPLAGAFAGEADGDLAARLAQLEKIVAEQSARIEQQEAQLSAVRSYEAPQRALVSDLVQEELDSVLDARIEDGLAAMKEGQFLSLGSGIDGLTLKGDARFRYERRDRDQGSTDRDRHRLRLRAGGVWTNKSENFEIGAGLEVGAANANSANATFSSGSPFESMAVFLDYAYAKHKWDKVSLTVGQMKNPFETTNVLFDSDIRPVGVVGQYKADGFFATAGVFDVFEFGDVSSAAEAVMAAGQIGIANEGEDSEYTLALGYYHLNGPANDVPGVGIAANNDDYDFQIIDVLGRFGTDLGGVGVELYGHYVVNIGADGVGSQSGIAGVDPDDENQAYVIGLSGKFEQFSAGYAYKHIEADAIYTPFGDSDFGTGVSGSANTEGHELKVGYKFSKNVSLGLTALLYEDIEVSGTEDGTLWQLDLKYKF